MRANLFMRTLLWAGIICLASIWSVFGATTREERWRRVDNAQRQFLLKTALTELEAIIPEAAAAKAYGEVARAIAQKAKFQAIFEKENQVFEITLLEQLIGSAPPETLPLLHTLLANWKWDYFRDNRWRFVGRSPVEVSTHDSIATWDLRRLFDDIDREFQKALSAEGALQATPIAVFEDMFEMGKRPARYRPTLYDFVVHEALSFYSAGEQAGAATEDTFQILSDSPVLDSVDQFLSWRPVTTQTNSPLFKAIRLHQDLLRFHQEDLDPTAFIAADLARLIFGKEVATGENAVDRFRVAVQALAERWSEQEASADAFAEWAQLIKDDGDFVRAREIAQRGMRYPISPGGIVCQSLIDEIEQKEAFISTERVWHRKPQKIQVRYRNIERVHFRAYAVDWSVPAQQITNLISSLESFEAGKALTEKRPTFEWSHPLEPTQDFQFQETEVEVPSLPPGFYVIAAGSSSDFAGKPENRSATKVWVSDLAVILRPRANRLEGFVLDAERGDPIPNAAVQLWIRSGAKKDWKPLDARTDRDGFFDFDSAQVGDARLMRVETDQRLVGIDFEEDSHLIHTIDWRKREDTSDPRQTILFTDRQIYRPGQLIHFKGLCLIADKEKSDYRVLPREEVNVVLHDPSKNEIKSLKLRSNKFGSFSGNFVIPHGVLSGAWSIKIAEGPEGSSSVQIEEYKRPRFRVALDSPRLGTRLNERTTVTGTALNLTGAPVDGAEVRYLITRKVAMPWWTAMEGDHYRQLWRLTQSEAEETQIAQGQTRTDSHGRFEISFRASENPFLKKQEGIVYSFILYSQVTGPAGETESEEKTIRVGKAALEAALEVDPWQTDNKPVVFRIRTQSLDGVGQPARGVVRVFSLQQPEKAQRPLPVRNGFDFDLDPISEWADRVKKDQSHQSNWPIAQEIASLPFMCNQSGDAQLSLKLPAGPYRAFLETEDSFGVIVKARGDVRVLDPGSKQFKIRLPSAVSVKSDRLEPGQQLIAIWGSGYPHARACIEFEHRDKIIRRFWTHPNNTQQLFKFAVTEAMRGGFTMHFLQVTENHAFTGSYPIAVPWSNKQLDIQWARFTSKLEPNQKKTWTATIRHSGEQSAPVEMVATLYDAALDQFIPPRWQKELTRLPEDWLSASNFYISPWELRHWALEREVIFRLDVSSAYPQSLNRSDFLHFYINASNQALPSEFSYPRFRPILGYHRAPRAPGVSIMPAVTAPGSFDGSVFSKVVARTQIPRQSTIEAMTAPSLAGTDLSRIRARKNLNETAFFFPHLRSDSKGVVRFEFTMPEALTEWRFLGFAHDRQLRSGFLEARAVTSRELMIQPNPPRFLREGDQLEFTVTILNQSDGSISGKTRLTFQDAHTGQSMDERLRNLQPELPFAIPARQSRAFAWKLQVPDGLGLLTYKALAATSKTSDGEEGLLPVLSRRLWLTESMPLAIRGPATNQFRLDKLLQSAGSDSLRHDKLSVQMVSNPAWYGVMALPYLMEFPHECAEQVFNRFYANALAHHIASSDPNIEKVFASWKNTPAQESPLERNPELKNVLLAETPWLRQARSETESQRNVAQLFDVTRMRLEREAAVTKLVQMRLSDGSWPWFGAGLGSEYITLYVIAGLGRLDHLGAGHLLEDLPIARWLQQRIVVSLAATQRTSVNIRGALLLAWPSLEWADDAMALRHADLIEARLTDQNNLSSLVCLYLYGRSFFLTSKVLPPKAEAAAKYFLDQSRRHWMSVSRQNQAQLAVALKRFGDDTTAQLIMKSLKERAVTSPELGMFWRDSQPSWWWYDAPIETQAMMIEAFDEVAHDAQAVEDCKVWLLKQKQTHHWPTTKATADAVYALLLRGAQWLSSDQLVEVSLGGMNVTPQATAAPGSTPPGKAPAVEAGTGYYEKQFAAAQVTPALGEILVRKTNPGIAWGSVHWQYFEDQSKVTAHAATPLKLEKKIFRKTITQSGPVLAPLEKLKVGDELIVRMILRVDRAMEYLHLKDQRGSGLEPVNVLSGQRYQDGLSYYESTRDTASHFFMGHIRPGTYVFEYPVRVMHKGRYQSGIAEIQCMYAPEFNSHSGSVLLEVE